MASRRRPMVRVGVAGWSIPAACRDAFGTGTSVLARYATRFDMVEINSSFYRPHQRKTYERWAQSVPRDFRFAVKLPQLISHELGLRRAREPVGRFVDECTGLGRKLGVVLVQLPASLPFERRVAMRFFTLLRTALPAHAEIVCEPRHRSWWTDSAGDVLAAHAVGRVGADPSPAGAPAEPTATGRCRYWRLHGSPRMYYSDYDPASLKAFCHRIATATQPSWVVFDNTAAGHAVPNALDFQRLIKAPGSRTS